MKIFAIVAVVFIAFVGLLVGSYVINANRANSLENQIIAQYDVNQVVLSELSLSVMETAQVPEMYKDDLIEAIKVGVEGRYGTEGNKSMFVAINEAYPGELSPALYANIQNAIESGRRNFSAEQKKLVDKVQIFRTELRNVWGGFWMRLAGYPTINFDDYGIVTDARTQDIFRTGTDTMIKIGD